MRSQRLAPPRRRPTGFPVGRLYSGHLLEIGWSMALRSRRRFSYPIPYLIPPLLPNSRLAVRDLCRLTPNRCNLR
jgi:hypothetical protein